jgi:hypothetical protein
MSKMPTPSFLQPILELIASDDRVHMTAAKNAKNSSDSADLLDVLDFSVNRVFVGAHSAKMANHHSIETRLPKQSFTCSRVTVGAYCVSNTIFT